MERAFAVSSVSKVYRSRTASVTALHDVSVSALRGETLAVLGWRGAGKSTLLHVLSGLLHPDSGSVRLGERIQPTRQASVPRIGIALQNRLNADPRLSIKGNLLFRLGLVGKRLGALPSCLWYFRELQLESWLDQPIGNLTRFLQRKAAIGLALAAAENVVMLDEPTNGLTNSEKQEVIAALQAVLATDGRCWVLASRCLDTAAAICQRGLLLQDGCVLVDETITRIQELVGLHSYQVVCHGRLTSEVQSSLTALPTTAAWVENGRTVVSFNLFEPSMFYEVMTILQAAGAAIQEIRREANQYERALRLERGIHGVQSFMPD